MNIVILSGDSYRHKYYFNSILDKFDVELLVKVKRSLDISREIKIRFLSPEDKKLLAEHTRLRNLKERDYFFLHGRNFFESNIKQIIETDWDGFNSQKIINAVKRANPDIILVFGTPLIKKRFLDILPDFTINLSGLSPYYKGSATLFWPFYFMEPQYAGHTFHIVDPRVDHGDILHQGKPQISATDTLPDIGCKDVLAAAKELPQLVARIFKRKITRFPQVAKGKIFYRDDFKPHHLRIIKFLLDGGFLKEYLSHRKLFPDPKIIEQL